ncbi:MAG: hypothetical protein ACRC42_03025 [Mycoplasma sp.]
MQNKKEDYELDKASQDIANGHIPDGFDVIDTYQTRTEQALIDNLFDYFGKVYYKTNSPSGAPKKVGGKYYSQFDAQLQKKYSSKRNWSFIKFLIFGMLSAGAFLSFVFFFDFDPNGWIVKSASWGVSTGWDSNIILYLIYILLGFASLFGLVSIIYLLFFGSYTLKCVGHRVKTGTTYQADKHHPDIVRNAPAEKVRNSAVSKYDEYLFALIKRIFWTRVAWAAFYFFLCIAGLIVFWFVAGSSVSTVWNQIQIWASQAGMSVIYMQIIVIGVFAIILSFALVGLVYVMLALNWKFKKGYELRRVRTKVDEWNQNYANFSHNLTVKGVRTAVSGAFADLVFDNVTPSYDRNSYNLHSKIYSFSNIPQDAQKIEFKNLNSGYYKGLPFNISYSKWEWFREAKVITQSTSVQKNEVKNKVSRSLKRFEDSICVLTVDTFSEPNLNFVLKNPDGRNITLQNKVFNDVFSLAVNNHKLAYKIFTPFVQHTFARCKTWSVNAKAIRQVIKEGTKLHVVFDGKRDFLNFEIITNPEYNYIFKSKDLYFKNVINEKPRISELNKRIRFGSLDESASLMAEYIFEEVDLFVSALEIAASLPMDDFVQKRNSQKTLLDVLEEKRLAASGLNNFEELTIRNDLDTAENQSPTFNKL